MSVPSDADDATTLPADDAPPAADGAACDPYAQVRAWIAHDPEPVDAAELTAVLAQAEAGDPEAAADLAERTAAPLQFGTAGLRGAIGAGQGRMNRAVVIRAAAGLAAYLAEAITRPNPGGVWSHCLSVADTVPIPVTSASDASESLPPRVVIGFDARHRSADFARDTAAVITAAGGQALIFPTSGPTPLLAFAVRHLQADAGVMVTASHNPARDNGYKVYLGGRAAVGAGQGVQIVPPADAEIAAHIAAAPPADEVPRAESGWQVLDDALTEAYITAALEPDAGTNPAAAPATDLGSGADAAGPRAPSWPPLDGTKSAADAADDAALDPCADAIHPSTEAAALEPEPDDTIAAGQAAGLRIVHTAMHGVGSRVALAVLDRAGFTDVHCVEAQREPDPEFPTVAFPNPEEPGAIDLAISLARQVEADLVIANDPDADRCAIAIRDPRREADGGWRMLHGDELGTLLGAEAARVWSGQSGARLANSIVSSRLLERIALAAGVGYARTLTGFKWIARTPDLVFGYEEAIGYCVRPTMVSDKDGITAGLATARLAARAKAEGRGLIDLLDDLARRHGLHLTGQVSARFDSPELIAGTVKRLREAPPQWLGGVEVVETFDLTDGLDGLPPTDGILLRTATDARVIVRPSGTEPKVKCYLEVIEPVADDASWDDITAARARAAEALAALATSIRQTLGV